MNESTPPPPPPENEISTAPAAPPPPPPAPVGTGAGLEGSGLSPTLAAGLAELFPPIGGIAFLLIEKKDAFVRFHSMQSLVFGVGLVVFGIVVTILTTILAFIPLLGWLLAMVIGLIAVVVYLASMVVWLVAAYKAFTGVEWEIPFVGKFAREQLAKTGGQPMA